MRDPYQILGVSRDASAAEIQRAYRKLAKTHHPDVNAGDKSAEEKFKEITVAHDLLGDADRRARFDAGEIDAAGAERPNQRYHRGFYAGPGASTGAGGHNNQAAFDEAIAELFRGQRSGGMGGVRGDVRYTLSISFIEAATGAKKSVTMPDGRALKITIPAGVREGQTLRLRGQGRSGFPATKPGDALVEVHIEDHPLFTRKDDDVHIEMPISLPEATLGAKVQVPTVSGPVTMTIPKGANSGQVLRLKGKGIPKSAAARAANGDQFVKLVVTMPAKPDPDLARLVAEWAESNAYNPRRGPGWQP